MHRGSSGNPDPDGTDLAFRPAPGSGQPDPRPAGHASPVQAVIGQQIDDGVLETPDRIHHPDAIGQRQDRITSELAGAVPGDLPAPVHVHHRGAVEGTLLWQGGPSRRVDGFVFQQDHVPGPLPGRDLGVHPALVIPRFPVVAAEMLSAQAAVLEGQHRGHRSPDGIPGCRLRQWASG